MKNSIRNISSFSAIVSFIALALLGCALMPLLPVKLLPSESLPGLSVRFSMPGSSARTVESEVTSRLESALNRIPGVKKIDSRSSVGSGRISLEFDRNTDLEVARFEAAMVIRQLWSSLPDNVSYPHISVRQVDDQATRPVISYTINADQQPAEIMRYADANIRPVLSRIPGVSKVDLSGATPMEWQIEYDNDLMTQLGISVGQIQSAISTYFGSEFLRMAPLKAGDDNSWTRITISLPEQSGELDLSKITVTTVDNQVITLDKIAHASHVEAKPTGYFRINGLNSVYLNVTATDDANQIDLSRQVKKVLTDMALPPGYMLDISYDASESIGRELDTIYFRTGLTVLILLVFVALITMSWRYMLLITISLFINSAIAFMAYYFLNVEIQLYSLAGITISLNLVIDNIIVMTEHIMRRHNLRAFSAVLAATLTTIGAMSVVFFLDEKTLLSLKDFVIVVIVNLSVSLLVALFLVPALIERMNVRKKVSHRRRFRMVSTKLMRGYRAAVRFLVRHKKLTYAVFILAFGLPVFMLPEKIESDGKFASLYNSTLGSARYKESIKPWVDCAFGGTLRLFAEKVENGGYYSRGEGEPTISISATLPNGATLSQMNALIGKMENFLVTQEGIRQFQTSVYGPRRANIDVFFKPEYQRTGYPYQLKADAISKALTLGGGSWSVYGLEDQGFSNDVRESSGSYRVRLLGYNYDDLYSLAEEVRDTLLTYKRIKEIDIKSEFSYWKDDYTEFYLEIDKSRLAKDSLSTTDLFTALSHELSYGISAGTLSTPDGVENIRLSSRGHNRDVWAFMNAPLSVNRKMIKLSDYATIERRQTPPDIVKNNQEYVVCLQYEYIGSNIQGGKLLDRIIEQFSRTLPMGYKIERNIFTWNLGDDSTHFLLLGLIALIIFFISSILFNSLRQPLAIIFVIPMSFIGVFLTFYLFNLSFDQGGFAAFILLSGITVNAAIYIINEYNSLRVSYPGIALRKLYFKAFRAKITAVLLTALSTVLGFIPFLIGDTREGFWFPLAAGTMGGLLMSLLAILFLLPIMIIPKKETHTKQ